MLAMAKLSSLLGPFVSYEENEVFGNMIYDLGCCHRYFFITYKKAQ